MLVRMFMGLEKDT